MYIISIFYLYKQRNLVCLIIHSYHGKVDQTYTILVGTCIMHRFTLCCVSLFYWMSISVPMSVCHVCLTVNLR